MILDKRKLQKFHCTKCDQNFELKHLVWFVKHYKFCGENNDKANAILHINDTEEIFNEQKDDIQDETKDLDVLIMKDNPRHKNMCQVLLDKDKSNEIWGCRKCYEAFENEEEFQKHVNSLHEGKIEHGTLYDEETKTYGCHKCKVFKTKKNIVYFIYHLKQCSVESQVKILVLIHYFSLLNLSKQLAMSLFYISLHEY